jgi:hypothetical protein
MENNERDNSAIFDYFEKLSNYSANLINEESLKEGEDIINKFKNRLMSIPSIKITLRGKEFEFKIVDINMLFLIALVALNNKDVDEVLKKCKVKIYDANQNIVFPFPEEGKNE